MSWVSINAQWAIASGALHFEHKPMAVDECPYNFDTNLINPANMTSVHNAE